MFKKGERIGEGTEKKIFADADNPDRVIAEYNRKEVESARQLKSAYYFQKIIRCLFPENFPDIHLASFKEKAVLVSDRVDTDEGHRAYSRSRIIRDEKPLGVVDKVKADEFLNKIRSDPRVKKLYYSLLDVGIKIDSAYSNFAYDPQDNLIYLDTSYAWSYQGSEHGSEVNPYYDYEKLQKAIEGIKDETVKRKAIDYLDRLERLRMEEEQEIKEGK